MNDGLATLAHAPPVGPFDLLGRPTPVPTIDSRAYDADAADYIRRVEAADGQRLEPPVASAINSFVVGCKAYNIWSSVFDVVLLCGARTLPGALSPLKGASPTNYNFVSADYARGGASLGLKGNGSTKSLGSGRPASTFVPTDCHASVFVSDIGTVGATAQYIGVSRLALLYAGNRKIRARAGTLTNDSVGELRAPGFIGVSRSGPSTHVARGNQIIETITASADAVFSGAELAVLARVQDGNASNSFDIRSDGRIAAYTIGTAVSLTLLEALVSCLIRDIQAALP